jgi:O-antigen/teichoic acid export membrane protein
MEHNQDPLGALPIKQRLRSWLGVEKVMLVNTASLVGTSLVTLSFGFVYWWLAAHRFSTESVGVASAAVSAMLLLASISVLGFGTLLIGELPRQPHKAHQLVVTALVTVGFVGFALGLGFALLAPAISHHLGALAENAWAVVLFALGVALTTITLVLDSVMIGLLRGGLQFWRNSVLGGSKLAILWAITSFTAWSSNLVIYGAWAAGALVSVAFLMLIFFVGGGRPRGWRFDWQLMRSLRKMALWHHSVNLGLQAPVFALPVVVTALLSPTKGAYFYAAWMIAGLVFIVPLSLSTVLFAMSAAQPAALRARMRQTIGHSAVIAIAAIASLSIAGPWLLSLFGKAYESQATTSLRVLIVAVLPLIVRNHYVAVSRVFGYLRRAALLVAATSMFELTAAVVGGEVGGLLGLTVGWVAAVYLEVLLMGPLVYRVMVGQSPAAYQRKSAPEPTA